MLSFVLCVSSSITSAGGASAAKLLSEESTAISNLANIGQYQSEINALTYDSVISGLKQDFMDLASESKLYDNTKMTFLESQSGLSPSESLLEYESSAATGTPTLLNSSLMASAMSTSGPAGVTKNDYSGGGDEGGTLTAEEKAKQLADSASMKELENHMTSNSTGPTFIGIDLNASTCKWIYLMVDCFLNFTGPVYIAAVEAGVSRLALFIYGLINAVIAKICEVVGTLGGIISKIIAVIFAIVAVAVTYIISAAASAGDYDMSYHVGFVVDWGIFCHWVEGAC